MGRGTQSFFFNLKLLLQMEAPNITDHTFYVRLYTVIKIQHPFSYNHLFELTWSKDRFRWIGLASPCPSSLTYAVFQHIAF